MLSRLYTWLDSRLKLEPVKETLLDEPIPGGASRSEEHTSELQSH